MPGEPESIQQSFSLLQRKPETILKPQKIGSAMEQEIMLREAQVSYRGSVPENLIKIRSSEDVKKFLVNLLEDKCVEHFIVIGLNARHEIIGWQVAAIGTETACAISPTAVLRFLLLSSSISFIVAHNHPSGDPSPSEDDLALTRRLNEAANLFKIRLLDHVIVGGNKTYSMDENGVLG